ncbi:M15 family metallopeptidase [Prosthecobacter sp. SYSU 5D2]|uniref:M15 family metallopeptidase n=1 Tax=Prosthecobacter sp. SYSU 5D2 TaxID=3134134 RepID=UPI0031FF05B5
MSSLPRLILLAALLCSCSAPAEKKGLVDIQRTIPGLSVDLRYKTAQNVTGRPLYPPDMPCMLRASTAKKLKKAQRRLRSQGYGLRVWDAWRPPEAHAKLYGKGAATGMFLDPAHGWSRHCGGVSVDVTLVDKNGNEQQMPTYFDEDLHKAASNQQPSDPEIRRNLALLNEAMTEAGFKALPGEWWHFDDLEFLYRPIPVIRAKDVGITIE